MFDFKGCEISQKRKKATQLIFVQALKNYGMSFCLCSSRGITSRKEIRHARFGRSLTVDTCQRRGVHLFKYGWQSQDLTSSLDHHNLKKQGSHHFVSGFQSQKTVFPGRQRLVELEQLRKPDSYLGITAESAEMLNVKVQKDSVGSYVDEWRRKESSCLCDSWDNI
ncbi:hypothetical protein Bca4012_064014 [Brassica carinata]|uniref:Uncharacterized protein n=1 Tax=Brassica carinata TaxID=52824 RepID=A0A8X7U059_BRACI|nr:hypothetical protein Bca52824_068126 [Brassica carinata]